MLAWTPTGNVGDTSAGPPVGPIDSVVEVPLKIPSLYSEEEKKRALRCLLSYEQPNECLFTGLINHVPMTCMYCKNLRMQQYNGMLILRVLDKISATHGIRDLAETRDKRAICTFMPRPVFQILVRELLRVSQEKVELREMVELLCGVRMGAMGNVPDCKAKSLFGDLCIAFDLDLFVSDK